jgi:plasmid segregation protein ParM
MSEFINVKSADDGYGDFKFNDGIKSKLIPNFVTSFKPLPESDFQIEDSHEQYIASKVGGKKYTIGSYAAKFDPNIKWIGGENKHVDSKFPILLKTCLGLMCEKPHEVIDTLVMGLPIKSYTDERQDQLKSIAIGDHQVDISLDSKKFFPKRIHVNDVIIKKQPFGSLYDVVLDGNGQLVNTDIAKGFNVVVDIGARTLNILTVNKLLEQPALTTHTNDGMYVAYDEVGRNLEERLGAIIPDGKLPGIIANKEIRGMDITELVNTAYADHANSIANTLNRIFINSWSDVTGMIFTGGGSELLKPYLKDYYQKANPIFLDRFATARGFRKYGVRETIKNKKKTASV